MSKIGQNGQICTHSHSIMTATPLAPIDSLMQSAICFVNRSWTWSRLAKCSTKSRVKNRFYCEVIVSVWWTSLVKEDEWLGSKTWPKIILTGYFIAWCGPDGLSLKLWVPAAERINFGSRVKMGYFRGLLSFLDSYRFERLCWDQWLCRWEDIQHELFQKMEPNDVHINCRFEYLW